VAVLGLGLLGGSVALAVRSRGVARQVAGATRSAEALSAALRQGALDEAGSYAEAARGAELVVLATPVTAMADVVRQVAPVLRPPAIVTDVGSVKAVLCETLPGLLPRGVSYVGAHPMAGSHLRGLGHARADLFDGAVCIVTRSPDAAALERTTEFWRALGARVVHRDAAQHDAEVAWMSHVPHVLAFAFASALEAAPSGAGAVAGAGFRDFTRIAQSDPELWGDILTANRKALAAPLARAQESLQELARALEANDADEVERRIAAARAALVRVSMQAEPAASEARSEPKASEVHGTSPGRAKSRSLDCEKDAGARGRRETPPATDHPEPSAASRRGGRGRRSNEPQ
jgi:prephenate dehydrogenase